MVQLTSQYYSLNFTENFGITQHDHFAIWFFSFITPWKSEWGILRAFFKR